MARTRNLGASAISIERLPGGLPAGAAQMLDLAREIALADAIPKPLLLGRHLLALGLPPGPQIGRLLEAAFEAQLDGQFEDVPGGLAWLRHHLEK